jgi:hypothetical protein
MRQDALIGLSCMICLLIPSCRDVQPFSGEVVIAGYQLDGTVTTLNGVPVDSVMVTLFYNFDPVGTTPLDTQKVIVQGMTRMVDITVLTPRRAFVRELFHGWVLPGTEVQRARWDGTDTAGSLVPSGKYLIRYTVDTQVVKYTPTVVDGGPTAFTDTAGRFSITADHLPIGEYFDLYRKDGSFYGVFMVEPVLSLEFERGGLRSVYPSVDIAQDKITTGAFTL